MFSILGPFHSASAALSPPPTGGVGEGPLVDSENINVIKYLAIILASANTEIHVHVLTDGQRRLGDLVVEDVEDDLVGKVDAWIIFHDYNGLFLPLVALRRHSRLERHDFCDFTTNFHREIKTPSPLPLVGGSVKCIYWMGDFVIRVNNLFLFFGIIDARSANLR